MKVYFSFVVSARVPITASIIIDDFAHFPPSQDDLELTRKTVLRNVVANGHGTDTLTTNNVVLTFWSLLRDE